MHSYKSMNFNFRLSFRNAVFIILIFLGSHSLLYADEWTQVASGGFGLSDQKQPDAMIIFNNYIYLATSITLPDGNKQPNIYRASIYADNLWSEFSPPWEITGEVTDMIIFQNGLYISNSAGQIWRLGSTWTDVTPDWPGTEVVYSLAPMLPRAGGHRLCAVRGALEIWCGIPGSGSPEWDQINVPPGFESDTTIQSAKLRNLGRNLFLGVGGGSAGSRMCEVWKLTTPARFATTVIWNPITTDCFGFEDDLTWIPAMAEFEFMLYIGTGGHGDSAAIYRTNGSDLEDVTPCSLYADCSEFALPPLLAPIRYGSMAVSGNRFYVGTRTPSLPGDLMGADVISRGVDNIWEKSNDPGFGVMGNDTVTALASGNGYLYAGVLNFISGLEVWRRTPPLIELFPFLLRDLREMIKIRAELRPCIFISEPFCPYNLDPLLGRIESIELAFERASFDDEELLNEAEKNIEEAKIEIQLAEQLAAQASKEERRGAAQKLLSESFKHVNNAVKITQSTIQSVKKTLYK